MRHVSIALASAAAAALVLAACGGHHGDGHERNTPVAPGAREIAVESRSFEFTPDEITVEAGEDVAIDLSSEDVFHDFVVDADGEDLHVVAVDGDESATGGLRIDEPGTYDFFCSVPGHRAGGMEGTLVVE